MTKTIEQKAIKFIDENHFIEKGNKILVALSGGADSVFLLSFLIKFKRRFGIEVVAFHLNHKIRGKSANDDEKFCIRFCSENSIKMISVSRDVKALAKKMKVSIEEAGRKVRYNELNKAAKKMNCTKIATAHNASDSVETVFLNFIKGTGIKGLTGIPIRRENIIRPILCLTSEEIRDYLKEKKISFQIDESNKNLDFERNFLRNEIIPKLKQRLNPKLEEKINNTSKIISDINKYIENEIKVLTKNVTKFDRKELRIELKKIFNLDKSLIKIFFKKVIENTFEIELSSENIFSLIDLLELQTGRSVQLRENIVATKERSEIVIRQKDDSQIDKCTYKIKVGRKIKIDGKIISIKEVKRKMFKFSSDKSVEYISGEGLRGDFEIKKWKEGDKFRPFGMKGTKKISDFLSDEKTDSMNKKQILVLTNGRKIIWVVGFRIDDRFRVTAKTKKILKLTLTSK